MAIERLSAPAWLVFFPTFAFSVKNEDYSGVRSPFLAGTRAAGFFLLFFFFGCSSLTAKHFGKLENASQMEKVGLYLLSGLLVYTRVAVFKDFS